MNEAGQKIKLYSYEVYSENFSSIVISDSVIGAVKEFQINNPKEHIIFVENVEFRNMEQVKKRAQDFVDRDILVNLLEEYATQKSSAGEDWISVEDDSLEAGKGVLFGTKDWVCIGKKVHLIYEDEYGNKIEPTHYKPLPNPPNKQKDGSLR